MAYPVLLLVVKKRSKTLTRPAALTSDNPMAHRPIGLCGMGTERQDSMGLVEGHAYQAKVFHGEWPPSGPLLRSVASPRPHKVFDLCALGLTQVKASGLVQVFDLPGRTTRTERIWRVPMRKTGKSSPADDAGLP